MRRPVWELLAGLQSFPVGGGARVVACESSEGLMRGSSEEGREVDAWAQDGEEGRGKLRKAMGSCKLALIHGCPNGETRPG